MLVRVCVSITASPREQPYWLAVCPLSSTHLNAAPTCGVRGSGSRVCLASARGVAADGRPDGPLAAGTPACFFSAGALPPAVLRLSVPLPPSVGSVTGLSGAVASRGSTVGSGNGWMLHWTAGTGSSSPGILLRRYLLIPCSCLLVLKSCW